MSLLGKLFPERLTAPDSPPRCQPRVIDATSESLSQFTRAELRRYANHIGVPPGKNKNDTIWALMESGKATLVASLEY